MGLWAYFHQGGKGELPPAFPFEQRAPACFSPTASMCGGRGGCAGERRQRERAAERLDGETEIAAAATRSLKSKFVQAYHLLHWKSRVIAKQYY